MNGEYRNGTWIWPTVISVVVGLIQAFGFYILSSVSAEINRLQHELENFETLSRKEFVKVDDSVQFRLRVWDEFKRVDTNVERLDLATRRMRETFLTKETYLARHDPLIADINRLTDRVNEFRRDEQSDYSQVRKDFGSTYTLNDKLKDLEAQIQRLQAQFARTPEPKP